MTAHDPSPAGARVQAEEAQARRRGGVDPKRTTAVVGAMFLMAMSAAGPGFIT